MVTLNGACIQAIQNLLQAYSYASHPIPACLHFEDCSGINRHLHKESPSLNNIYHK